jgi:hypothetical protein
MLHRAHNILRISKQQAAPKTHILRRSASNQVLGFSQTTFFPEGLKHLLLTQALRVPPLLKLFRLRFPDLFLSLGGKSPKVMLNTAPGVPLQWGKTVWGSLKGESLRGGGGHLQRSLFTPKASPSSPEVGKVLL